MTFDDLIAFLIMAAAGLAFAMRSIVRTLRRMAEARPRQEGRRSAEAVRVTPRPPPARVDEPAARSRVTRRAPEVKRRPSPSLESRLFQGRRLSPGARLVVASEILSRPKALRRRP